MATLRHLETFIAVADAKKMSVAAKITFLSQPTVSQIIAALEEEFNTKLFERRSKTLELTPSGDRLYYFAKNVLSSYETLSVEMDKPRFKKPLRIGATLTVGESIIGGIVKKLNLFYKDIDEFVYVENTRALEQRLTRNEIDIALVEGTILNENIHTEPVISDSLQLICSKNHPFALKSSVDLVELTDQQFVLREFGSGTRKKFEQHMTERNIKYKVVGEFSSALAIIEYVKHDLSLSVISPRCVTQSHSNRDIHCCTINGIDLERQFYLCYRKNSPITAQMQKFIDVVKDYEM